jgi:hypothetical protein
MSTTTNTAILAALAGLWPSYVQDNLIAHPRVIAYYRERSFWVFLEDGQFA